MGHMHAVITSLIKNFTAMHTVHDTRIRASGTTVHPARAQLSGDPRSSRANPMQVLEPESHNFDFLQKSPEMTCFRRGTVALVNMPQR